MRTNDPYLHHLRKITLLAGCTVPELRLLARLGTDVTFVAGQVPIREGRPGYEFFIIVAGTAAVTRAGTHVATLGPGDFFGESALLGGDARNATVTAQTALETLVVQSQDFRGLLEHAPNLVRSLTSGVARRGMPVGRSAAA